MTATVRPCVKTALMRHDTEGEWIITGSPTGEAPTRRVSSLAASRCGSPVRDNWTILSESQVEISYKAALTATPVTAPCSPDMEDGGDEPAASPPPPPPQAVRPAPPPTPCKPAPSVAALKKATPQPEKEDEHVSSSEKSSYCSTGCGSDNGVAANVSSDEDFGYYRRKSRVAGNGANKSRNNRKK